MLKYFFHKPRTALIGILFTLCMMALTGWMNKADAGPFLAEDEDGGDLICYPQGDIVVCERH